MNFIKNFFAPKIQKNKYLKAIDIIEKYHLNHAHLIAVEHNFLPMAIWIGICGRYIHNRYPINKYNKPIQFWSLSPK